MKTWIEWKEPWLEWDWTFDPTGSENLLHEFLWMLKHGTWYTMWDKCPTIGAGRFWYDGPHWFLHLGFVSIGLISGLK